MIEVLIGERDERREGAEVLVEEIEGRRSGGDREGTVEERDAAEVILLAIEGRQLVFLGKEIEAIFGEEREVAKLLRVSGDEGAATAIKNGKGGGEVALGGFVNDDEVEEAGLQRQHAMNIVGGGDPDGEVVEEGL